MELLATHSFNFALLGETGTSKTASMKRFIQTLSSEKWDQMFFIFSATTNAS